MTKRNLRVAKWLGTIPAVGVCTLCNRELKVPVSAMKRVADAQESLRLQFAAHKCKSGTASETPPAIDQSAPVAARTKGTTMESPYFPSSGL